MASEEDDGYISLNQRPESSDQMNLVKGNPPSRQGAAASASLLNAAESSDSQGSLPEIDSGQSSDSSDSE